MLSLSSLFFRFAVATLFFALVAVGSASAQDRPVAPLPRVVMGPPGKLAVPGSSEFKPNRAGIETLFEHPEQWAQTRALVNEILFADHNFDGFTDDQLRRWFAQLKAWDLKLELEVGAVKPWGKTGRGTFEKERVRWDRIQQLGGVIASIATDDALAAIHELKMSREEGAPQMADFIALVRENYPQFSIVEVEPYTFVSLDEHRQWIAAVDQLVTARKVRGIDGYRLDTNWATFGLRNEGSWLEVAELRAFCRSRKLPFSLIFWASHYGSANARKIADDSSWYSGIMEMGYAWTLAQNSRRGKSPFPTPAGPPDQYVIESWVGAPVAMVPETGEFTFTRSVQDFVHKFVR